jgi:hypothetical protein
MSSLSPNELVLAVQPASRLVRRPLEWLWQCKLAFGKLAMLDGDPDQGKSLVALDLCARLSRGREMPDGGPGPGPVASLILQEEDDAEDTVLPRLKALGADTDRVFVWGWRDLGEGPPQFPAGAGMLGRVLAQTGARLVVIDPVMAFLDQSVAANSEQAVRRALRALSNLARQFGCVVLLVRHLNKEVSLRAMYRGGGSIGLLAACRSAWLIGRDPEAPQRRVLAQVKNNLAVAQPSLAYEVVTGEGDSPAVTWHGPSRWTADELLAAADRRPAAAPQRDRACDFLAEFLKGGPRTVREVWAAAQEQGISEHTLRRARKERSVRSRKVWRGEVQTNYWLLPGQTLEGIVPHGRELDEWDRKIAELEKMYPPASPFEDE